jgi:hypothetical protein
MAKHRFHYHFLYRCLFVYVIFYLGATLARVARCGSGASGLPAPPLLRCGRVCALSRAPYRPLALNGAFSFFDQTIKSSLKC